MKAAIANLKKMLVGREISPKKEVYSSRDNKEVILLGLNRKEDHYLLFLEVTNGGAVKVNPLKAAFSLSSTKQLLEPVQRSLDEIRSCSLSTSKLPLFARMWIGMREGILESYHLFDLNDDKSVRNLTEVYFYRNKSNEEKIRISRTTGRGKKRELETKIMSLDAYKALCDGLSELLKAEQVGVPNSSPRL